MTLLRFALILVVGTGLSAAGEFTANGTQPELGYGLISSESCRFCHADFGGEGVMPWSTWSGSMMGNASRDPLFWAALDVANEDLPGIGEWCVRCHVPAGWLGDRAGSADGCDLEGTIDTRNNDFDGITCHLCHRMQENPNPPRGQEPLYLENGQWWIDDEPCKGVGFEPCRRGPYDYDAEDDTLEAPHPWDYSALHESSQICGQCHNVTSPVNNLLIDGRDAGIPFPIERTYREWERSAFADEGVTCQNCHMPDATGDDAYACIFFTNDRDGDMPVHSFVGGNTWIPEVLRGEYPSLDLDQELALTAQRSRELLQNETATVKLALQPGEPLRATVKVTNLTGHKLPTGYHEGRRIWLHVEALDATGTTFWESGAYDPLSGELAHDDQLKVYEAIYGVWNEATGVCETTDEQGREQFHFVLNDCIVKDNRIPPRGFDAKPDLETASVGYSYPLAADGRTLEHHDLTEYTIPVPLGARTPIEVVATLRFQTTSKEYVEFLRDRAVEGDYPDDCIERSDGTIGMSRGEYLYDVWERYDRSPPVDIDSERRTLGQMRVVDRTGDRVELSFGATAVAYVGPLDSLASGLTVDRVECDLDGSSLATGAGNRFWLLGPAGRLPGTDSAGRPRTAPHLPGCTPAPSTIRTLARRP